MNGIESPARLLVVVAMAAAAGGCSIMRFTGETVETAGKVTVAAVKTTGAVITTTGKIGHAGYVFIAGKRKIKLDRRGNTLYVDTIINGKYRTKLVLDTGATEIMISAGLAGEMGIPWRRGEATPLGIPLPNLRSAFTTKGMSAFQLVWLHFFRVAIQNLSRRTRRVRRWRQELWEPLSKPAAVCRTFSSSLAVVREFRRLPRGLRENG